MSPLHSVTTLRTLGALNPSARALMLSMHEQANGHGAPYDGDWSIEDGPGNWEKICKSFQTSAKLDFQFGYGSQRFSFKGTVVTLHKIRGGFPTATVLISLEGYITNWSHRPDWEGTLTIFWNTGAVRSGFVLMPTKMAMEIEQSWRS